MSSIASTPAARRLFVISIAARLPLAMLGIGLLVHAQHVTGSLVAAGAATGAYALGLAGGGPVLGRLADRRGQTRVLVGSAVVSAAALAGAGALPAGVPAPAVVGLAAAIGASVPPVGACVRALLPGVLADDGSVRAAYALDASAVELTWVAGPPLVLGAGAVLSTGAALALAGAVMLVATAAFAAQPASRRREPVDAPRERGGSLRSPAVRTLVLALLGVGGLLGAAEVAVTAAAGAASAGPLLALWGAGSLVGGAIAARAGGGALTGAGLAGVLAALAAGHLALAAVAGSALSLAAGLLVAGAAIAPAYATVYAMVERAAPAGTLTEAFAWLATAAAVGGALGSAAAGAVAEAAGPEAAFGLAGAAGAFAVVVALCGAGALEGGRAAAPAAV